MQLYAKIINTTTGGCTVGLGDDVEYYKSLGMTVLDVEEAEDGGWYLKGYVPEPSAEYKANKLFNELKYEADLKTAQLSIGINDDATAFILAPICHDWEASHHYEEGEIINHKNVSYRVVQAVDSLEHQPPDATGMLAIYRPIDPAVGTLEDPKTFRLGMDVHKDLYYTYNGKIYLAKADMIPCTWSPDTVGMWQWEEVK